MIAGADPNPKAPTAGAVAQQRAFVVVPCLNEEHHLEQVLLDLLADTAQLGLPIVVVDGGSTDSSRGIVQRLAEATGRVQLLINPRRLQGAGINLAVARFGDDHEFLIRVDAHSEVTAGFCAALIAEADETKAASVTCPMVSVGMGRMQAAIAIAQNSWLGNGGSAHRLGTTGGWVDHGHHALMRVDAFRAVGGYDETFQTNEDAELDTRLRRAGYRIWLTVRTSTVYFPRKTLPALFKQYWRYGHGRARTVLKHRARPRFRQIAPLAVPPALGLATFAAWNILLLAPAASWAGACLVLGASLVVKTRRSAALLSPLAAMTMHVGWACGFWARLATAPLGGVRS